MTLANDAAALKALHLRAPVISWGVLSNFTFSKLPFLVQAAAHEAINHSSGATQPYAPCGVSVSERRPIAKCSRLQLAETQPNICLLSSYMARNHHAMAQNH